MSTLTRSEQRLMWDHARDRINARLAIPNDPQRETLIHLQQLVDSPIDVDKYVVFFPVTEETL